MTQTQFDKLVDDVRDATRQGRVTWTTTSNEHFAQDVLHGGTIFRSFAATYDRNGETYRLGYVERKVPHDYNDGEFPAERRAPELLVFKNKKLILSVTEYHVDDLDALGNLISDQNDDARSLLATF